MFGDIHRGSKRRMEELGRDGYRVGTGRGEGAIESPPPPAAAAAAERFATSVVDGGDDGGADANLVVDDYDRERSSRVEGGVGFGHDVVVGRGRGGSG